MQFQIKRQEIEMITGTKFARTKITSTVQSCPSLQAIVNRNNIQLKSILLSESSNIWTTLL